MSSIEHNPAEAITHTVICLHGLGASGSDLLPIAKQLNLPGVRFVFPSAKEISVTLNQGYRMPAWYDIKSMHFSSEFRSDHKGVDEACETVKALIADEQAAYGLGTEAIFLMGFSQGGSIALELGLHYTKKLAGIIGLSTLPAKGMKTFEGMSSENEATSIFLAHGSQDQVVPFSVGELLVKQLKERPLTSHCYPMGHEICQQELLDIKQYLRGQTCNH
jgi:phospholipase/carboxylesterase